MRSWKARAFLPALSRITLPMITPTAFLVFVLAWINAFKIFKEVYFIAARYGLLGLHPAKLHEQHVWQAELQLVTAALIPSA